MEGQKSEDFMGEERKDAIYFCNEVWMEVIHYGGGRGVRGYEMKHVYKGMQWKSKPNREK